jgi:hypothetical protein
MARAPRIALPLALALIAASATSMAQDRSHGTTADARSAKPATENPNPLTARAHLPIQVRLSGLVFVSKQPMRPGIAPGLLANGFYALVINPKSAQWWHADSYEEFSLQMNDDGRFTATLEDREISGRFDQDNKQLTWEGQLYACTALPSPIREAPPDWHPDVGPLPRKDVESPLSVAPSAISRIKNGLEIDLTSPRKDYAAHGWEFGSVAFRSLGHDGDYCVFDYILETEGGYSVYRHRLPISQDKATIQRGHGQPLKTSFDRKDSRAVGGGNLLINKVPAGVYPWMPRGIAGNPKYLNYTQELLYGKQGNAKPNANVELRCWFYSDENFLALRHGSKPGEILRFCRRQVARARCRSC